MTTRRSVDLDVPPIPRKTEEQSSARLRRFPLVVDPWAVFLMAERQREAARAKAVARHERGERRRAIPASST
ncbi:MAG TPA: hypothetical protein VGM13_06450 [Thermoanaerobaculia bacterium]|jgi:hypothetical protein